jgi:hypothetical protein
MGQIERATSYILTHRAHLSRFHLKTETGTVSETSCLQMKTRKMDKVRICESSTFSPVSLPEETFCIQCSIMESRNLLHFFPLIPEIIQTLLACRWLSAQLGRHWLMTWTSTQSAWTGPSRTSCRTKLFAIQKRTELCLLSTSDVGEGNCTGDWKPQWTRKYSIEVGILRRSRFGTYFFL